ncbi:MAG: tRNA (N(6)-L-threonylcarbamoyladenosine(37)-C(2))-methylthiotransferase MtaB [Bacteroidota bacterium]
MKSVAFHTLGCKLNFSESSAIARTFEARGFTRASFEQGADIYVINTCSVTDHADKKCRKVVKEALKLNPAAFIAIVGCYAQLKPEEIANIPGVDVVLGASEKFRLPDLLPELVKTGKAAIYNSPIAEANVFTPAYSAGDRTRTFLKVQDGCDYSCSFCTIPLARGASRSPGIESILQQVSEIAASGVKEIVLTGVNIGDFGIENGKRSNKFADLVNALDNQEGIERFRISSIEPNLLSDEIIGIVAQSKKFVPHFHIPLQSGSNKTLAAMRRRYKRELYVERVAAIHSQMPGACIGADVIVGFPGETKEDFLETYNFLNELNVQYLHVFTYSERPNTLAVTLPGAVPGSIRAERSRMLHILSDKKRRDFYEQHIGKTYPVLMEGETENGMMFGFTPNYIRVAVPYDPLLVNEIVPMSMNRVNEQGRMDGEEVQSMVLA